MAFLENYSTCPHLQLDIVVKSMQAAQNITPSNIMTCGHCNMSSSMQDSEFLHHFVSEQHHICVRCQPTELYCVTCRDYQYHYLFDRLMKRSYLRSGTACNALSHQTRFPRPMTNMGNTCFLNSIMQVLLANPILIHYFKITQHIHTRCALSSTVNSRMFPKPCCVACEVQQLFRDSFTAQTNKSIEPVIPSQLLCAVWRHASHLAVPDQHDAHEFLMALLDGYCSHAEKYHNIPLPDTPSKAGSYHFKGIFNETFCGVLRSDLRCESCEHWYLLYWIYRIMCNRSAKYDPFVDVSVSLEDVDTQLKVQDMLKKFTSVETLHDKAMCENCKMRSVSEKRLSIMTPPNVLIIHLKRFERHGTLNANNEYETRKINTFVSYPIEALNLFPYTSACIAHTDSNGSHNNEVSVLYDLQGVVSHIGPALSQGHYVSYVRDAIPLEDWNKNSSWKKRRRLNVEQTPSQTTAEWIRCDDEDINTVGEDDVTAAQGYLLVYMRRELNYSG